MLPLATPEKQKIFLRRPMYFYSNKEAKFEGFDKSDYFFRILQQFCYLQMFKHFQIFIRKTIFFCKKTQLFNVLRNFFFSRILQ